MPIPSVRTVVSPPTPTIYTPAPPVLVLTGANGDSIRLDDQRYGFYCGARTNGIFGLPPVELQTQQGAGDGSRFGGIRVAERPIDMQITVKSATASEQRARLDRLADVLDILGLAGPATLTVIDPDRALEDARNIQVRYSTGWDGATDTDTDLTFDRLSLTVTALDPYFTGSAPIVVPISTGAAQPLLSATLPLFPLRLAPSQVLGQLKINNPGDVPAFAVWRFAGPGGPIVAYPGSNPADGFRINTTLSAGQSLTLDAGNGTLVDQAGADAYSLIDPNPGMWLIPPGTTTASVSMTSATSASSVTLTFWPRFKRGR